MLRPIGVMLTLAILLVVGACQTTAPEAPPPPGPEGMQGDY